MELEQPEVEGASILNADVPRCILTGYTTMSNPHKKRSLKSLSCGYILEYPWYAKISITSFSALKNLEEMHANHTHTYTQSAK